MASTTQLVEEVSRLLGVPEPTVGLHLRTLRDAGLITLAGRGRNSAKMTPQDGANLLLGVMGSRNVKDSPSIIQRPGALVTSQGVWRTAFASIPELEALPAVHSFAAGVEALISAAMSGSLQTAAERLEGGSVDLIRDVAPALNIEVTILGPIPRGTILVQETIVDDQGDRRPYEFHTDHRFYSDRPSKTGAGNLAWYDMARPDELESDLQTRMTVSHKTIAAIGKLLAGDSAA